MLLLSPIISPAIMRISGLHTWHREMLLAFLKKSAEAAKKEVYRVNCEMDNPELRFIDMRSRAGHTVCLSSPPPWRLGTFLI